MHTSIYSCNSAFCILAPLLSWQGPVVNFHNILQRSKPVCQHLSLFQCRRIPLLLKVFCTYTQQQLQQFLTRIFLTDIHEASWPQVCTSKQWPHHKQSNLYMHFYSSVPCPVQCREREKCFQGNRVMSGAACFLCSSQTSKTPYTAIKCVKWQIKGFTPQETVRKHWHFVWSASSHSASLVASWIGAGRNGRKSNPGVVGGVREKIESEAARFRGQKIRAICTR